VHGKVRPHTPDSIEQLVPQLVEECNFFKPNGAFVVLILRREH
jgi:hypothetical protein